MAEELGGECGFTSDYGSTCDREAYNPVKILKDPLVTPDGRYHWRVSNIEYLCAEHAREYLCRGNTIAAKASYEELQDLIKENCIQVNTSGRKPEKQESDLKEANQ